MTKAEQQIKPGKTRLQFDFYQEALESLDYIVNSLGFTTRAAGIRWLISIGVELIKAKHRGAELIFQEQDGSKTKVIII